MTPAVCPDALPVIVLFPRVSKVPEFPRLTPKLALFANTQLE